MSYYPTSPQANEDPRVSQGRLLANFGKMNTDFSVNHQPLTVSLNQGFHTLIQFAETQIADPNLPAPNCSLYPKTVSGLAELFFQNDNNPANVFQLTGITPTVSGTNYTYVTPWKLQIQMGTSNASPQNYALAFPGSTVILTALVSPITGTNARVVSTAALNQFTWTVSGGGGVRYLIIGQIP